MADYGYVHSCVIWSHVDASQNEYGEVYSHTDSSQNTACRFYFSRTGRLGEILTTQSGEHAKAKPLVMLPGTVTVSQGNTIVSTETGFAHTYTVTATKPVYYLFYNSIHHYECELEVVS